MALIKGKQLAANTVTLGKLQTIEEAKLLVGAANGQITAVALSSDATITAAGALTIANSAVTTAKIADTSVTTDKLADDAVTLAKIADAAFASDFTSGELSKLPTASVVKTYVDSVAQGLDVKQSVKVATVSGSLSNFSFSSNELVESSSYSATLLVDTVSLALNDRVLVKDNNMNPEYNGIYAVTQVGDGTSTTPWKLGRAVDFDSSSDASPGSFCFVEQGAINADTGYVLSTNGPITLNTTALTFTQFSSAGIVEAGSGLTKTGNTLSIDLDGNTLAITGGGIKVASAGITATEIATSALGNALTGGAGTAISVTAHSQASVGVHSTGLYAAVLQLQQFAASATSADGDSAAATTIAKTPAADSAVQVFVNGVLAKLTGDKLGDCYFSADAGATAKALADIASGDSLRWNGSLAGYQLESSDLLVLSYTALNAPA